MYVKLVTFLLFLHTINGKSPDFHLIKNGISEVIKTGSKPLDFLKALENYQLPHVFRERMENAYDNEEICALCDLLFDLIVDEREHGTTKQQLQSAVEYLCIALGIETERVCIGAISQNIDIALYIMDNYPDIKSERLCGSVLQAYGCSKGESFNWSINLPSGNAKTREIETTGKIFQILQLSDIHYDPYYTANANANCGEPVCCQFDQGQAENPEDACGYWTDYRLADIPWYFVEETIKQTQTHEFDYVYYTGDIISHRVWETSVENNTKTIARLYDFFKDSYTVPVYPIFGNHEPHPLNVWTNDDQLQDDELSVRWLFQLAAEKWSLLVGEDITETALKGGYYTVSPRPGFRIIALNGNICYTDNWWLIFDDVDPFGQLQWLVDTLKLAEDNNESVHILSHVPTGDVSCLEVWSREYNKIVQRFATIITGQFNGHTHRDEFHIYYNGSEPTQPVGVAFNGASVTPYDNSNPSYKIYQVEDKSFSLIDYEEWTFNLTLANSQAHEPISWYKLYSFLDAYQINNLQASEVNKVLYKMVDDPTLLDDYFRFYYRNGDPGIQNGCDENCRKTNLCDIAKSQFGDYTQCNFFLDLYERTNKKRSGR